ncbi:MAG: PhoH family protein [Sedimentisphaerales bacterium]|nr:PhoH family protein [Sedimentisphaerales bacterium]
MEVTVQLESPDRHVELFGPADSHLRFIRQLLGVRIATRKTHITITGEERAVTAAVQAIEKMQHHLGQYGLLRASDVEAIVRPLEPTPADQSCSPDGITVFAKHKIVRPSTEGQRRYIQTMLTHDITFCTGPAGTGKTYLAVAVAVSMLRAKQLRRIVLARPAVEAGERLGFLPGDIQAKVNPYLRPLFDALEDMMDFAQMRKFLDLDIIEIIPLAFMRGRTLNEAAIICDEAQNTSDMQMLMVLTRLGHGSKMIITGDVTQVDLEPDQPSGLVEAIQILKGIPGIGLVELHKSDIVRHRLVQDIVDAYNLNGSARRPRTGRAHQRPSHQDQ